MALATPHRLNMANTDFYARYVAKTQEPGDVHAASVANRWTDRHHTEAITGVSVSLCHYYTSEGLSWINRLDADRIRDGNPGTRPPGTCAFRRHSGSTPWNAWVNIRWKSCKLRTRRVWSDPAKISQLTGLADESSSRQRRHVAWRLGLQCACHRHHR